jgi:LmbE family N-acetylglucosaminyl deacetylase
LDPERITFFRLPDTAAPTHGPAFAATVAELVTLIRRYGCRSLLASWSFDPHCDHEAASLIASAAAREAGVVHWAYPVWGRTVPSDTDVGLCTAVRLDITRWQASKRQAIQAHRSQWAGLIPDDPTGFQMQPDFMTLFDTPTEMFLRTP